MNHAAFLAGNFFVFSPSKSSNWILYSGAIYHISPHSSLFDCLIPVSKPLSITLPNGKHAPILHTSSIQLSPQIILHDVLHVPDFHFNLLSISKLTSNLSSNITFTSKLCLLQDPLMNKPVVIGHEENGLYIINRSQENHQAASDPSSSISLVSNFPSCNATLPKESLELWHCHMGHINFDQLKFILNFDAIFKGNFICQICPKAKQHHKVFSHRSIPAPNTFDLIHLDT